MGHPFVGRTAARYEPVDELTSERRPEAAL
jgi:hypothetical protein